MTTVDRLVCDDLADGECRALEHLAILEGENVDLRADLEAKRELLSVALEQIRSLSALLDRARWEIRSSRRPAKIDQRAA